VSIVDGFCNPRHNNASACDWGAAIFGLAIEYASHCKDLFTKVKEGKISCEAISRGRNAFSSKHNTRIVYSGVIADNSVQNPLTTEEFSYFDQLHYDYLKKRISLCQPVPTTDIKHDYILCYEDIIFISGEALSTTIEDEIIKVLLTMFRSLTYLETAFGVVSTADTVYILKAEYCEETAIFVWHVYCRKYIVNDVSLMDQGKTYSEGIMQIIEFITAIIREQQLGFDEIIQRYNFQSLKPEHYVQENQSTRRTIFPLSCAFYLGTVLSSLKSLTLDYQVNVYWPAQEKMYKYLCQKEERSCLYITEIESITKLKMFRSGIMVHISEEDVTTIGSI